VGSGVPLLWPATSRSVRVPYAVYAGGCLALAGRALARWYGRPDPRTEEGTNA
jgi:hypothetical protein